MQSEINFILTFLSTLLILYIFIVTLKVKEKYSLHYAFLGMVLSLFLYSIATIIEYKFFLSEINDTFFIMFIGVCLAPPFFLLTGYFFARPEKHFSIRHSLVFIIPVISIIIACTNRYHKLFAEHFSVFANENNWGVYFPIHAFYSYICIILGYTLLIYFSIKNSGIFSRQALLIVLGTILPLILNIFATLGFISADMFLVPISFMILMVFIWIAIIRYDFLNIIPIALQQVVNHISDGFIVLSKDYVVIEYNKAFSDMFSSVLNIKKREKFSSDSQKIDIDKENIKELINQSVNEHKIIVFEKAIIQNNFNKHFKIEITPLFLRDKHIGTIILFKDITEQKQYIEILESKNNELDEINAELQAQNDEIQSLNNKLRELAQTDGLTGAYNRRFFNEYYDIEVTRVLNWIQHKTEERSNMDFGIALLDIDDFKKVNDVYGHIAGDDILKQVVAIVKNVIFSRDIICRYGGEEFAILFTNTPKNGAIQAAEKIRVEIEKYKFTLGEEKVDGHVTVSIGFASFDDYGIDKKNLLQIADERLYKAKKTGKNKVVYN